MKDTYYLCMGRDREEPFSVPARWTILDFAGTCAVAPDLSVEQMAEEAPEADETDPRIGNQELAAFLAGHYPDAGWSRDDHYTWISGLLLELGITSLRELAGLLPSVDSEAIAQRMGYKYPPGAVRRLDDALLAQFGTRYLELHGNAHRADLLRTRLEKLRGDGPAPATDRSVG